MNTPLTILYKDIQIYCVVTAVVAVATRGAVLSISATEEDEEERNIMALDTLYWANKIAIFSPQVGLQHLDKVRERKSRQNADNFKNFTTADV